MTSLLDAVTSIALQLPPEKVVAISERLRGSDVGAALSSLASSSGTPVSRKAIESLLETWKKNPVPTDELAGMLLAAVHSASKVKSEQILDLVWTGPTTPFASTRRTEQVLLQVIEAAKSSLFITSFVAYEVSSIVGALNAAASRGVVISMLLESSQDHGGSIDIDVIGRMKKLVPSARLYAWREKDSAFADGRVHAKVAVADGQTCFLTSANLTGFAMERNMEMGVLIRGGHLPGEIHRHLDALVDTRVVERV